MDLDKDIIQLIRKLVNRSFMTLTEIQNETDATKRQIMYRLEKLNILIEDNNLIPITIGNQKEFIITNDTRDFLVEFLYEINDDIDYYFDREERKIYIYLRLFIDREYVSLQHFISTLQISKSTIIQDINELSHELKEQNIVLKNDRTEGYYLEGSEMNIRRFMMKLLIYSISEHQNTLVFDKFVNDLHLSTFDYSKLIIQELAETYDISFVEDRLTEFIYIYIFLSTRIIEGRHVNPNAYNMPNLEMIQTFKEYKFTNALIDYFPNKECISDLDRKYISSWILGISVGNVEDMTEDCLIIGQLVGKIMTRFELLSGVHYRDSETIFRHIFSHFRPAYYRLLFKLPIYNPLKNRVIDEYNGLYLLVKETMKPFASIFGEEINDDELAYLTMHFASVYTAKREEEVIRRKKALIVCLNGIGSSVILYYELSSLFPELEFQYPIEVSQFNIDEYPADIVFTTQYFRGLRNLPIPVIKVSPIMDASERYSVFREVSTQLNFDGSKHPSYDEISTILRKHVGHVEQEQQLIHELMSVFLQIPTSIQPVAEEAITLRNIISEDLVSLKVDSQTPEEVLQLSGDCLLNAGMVTQQYVDSVLSIQKMNPTYYVIAPHIALPHTTPTKGALKLAMGITTLKTPIYFGNNEKDPVKYVFYLSAIDNESHIGAMTELLELMNDEKFLSLLDKTEDVQEVLDYIAL